MVVCYFCTLLDSTMQIYIIILERLIIVFTIHTSLYSKLTKECKPMQRIQEGIGFLGPTSGFLIDILVNKTRPKTSLLMKN